MKKTIIRFGTALLGATLFTPSAFAADGMVQENHMNHEVPAVIQKIGDSFQDAKIRDTTFEVTAHKNTQVYDENVGIARFGGRKYKVTGNDVNVRSGAGTNYKIISKLQRGDIIKVKSIDNGWARFDNHGTDAYVSANYIQRA